MIWFQNSFNFESIKDWKDDYLESSVTQRGRSFAENPGAFPSFQVPFRQSLRIRPFFFLFYFFVPLYLLLVSLVDISSILTTPFETKSAIIGWSTLPDHATEEKFHPTISNPRRSRKATRPVDSRSYVMSGANQHPPRVHPARLLSLQFCERFTWRACSDSSRKWTRGTDRRPFLEHVGSKWTLRMRTLRGLGGKTNTLNTCLLKFEPLNRNSLNQ